MIIGFDAKRAFNNKTGIGNYSRSLIKVLSSFYPDNQLHLFTPNNKEIEPASFLHQINNVRIHYPTLPIGSSFWRTYGITKLLSKFNIELYHGLSHEIPIGIQKTKTKSIVTIHDLIFLRYPEYYKAIDRKIYYKKFRYACENADKIIAISEQTKRDIIEFYNIPSKKIEVVYQGCAPEFAIPISEEKKKEVTEKYCLPDGFLLNVGTIEPRKNLMIILQTLNNFPNELQLVVVGKPTEPYFSTVMQYLKANNLTHRVIFLSNIAWEDLPAIYQLAGMFIYPSIFEGFGIPILEALNANVPVIAATGSCLEEAGGPHSMYFSPNDAAQLTQSIWSVMSSNTLSEKMKEVGKKYAQNFSDEKIAQNLMNLYHSVLQR